MTPTNLLLLSLLHPLVALISLCVNQYATHRRTIRGSRSDGGKLRVALETELACLRDLCRENVEALYAGREALTSCRIFMTIYRGNLARLHMLEADDIPLLVAAYAMGERAEALAAVHGKAHGPHAYLLGKERPFADALVAQYEKAAAAAERALRALDVPVDALPALPAEEEALASA